MDKEQWEDRFERDETWHSYKLTAWGCMQRHKVPEHERREEQLNKLHSFMITGNTL